MQLRMNGWIAGVAVSLAAAVGASAASIDFTNAAFANVGDSNPYAISYDGVGMTLSASDAFRATQLSWTAGRGIGVDRPSVHRWDDGDQIDDLERFKITLDQEETVTSISVSSLFREGWQNRRHETGWVNFNDGEGRRYFSANDGDGFLTLDFGTGIETTVIEFGARIFGSHDFAVAGFTTAFSEGNGGTIDPQDPGNAVPEPSAATLFGLGGAAVAVTLRRKP